MGEPRCRVLGCPECDGDTKVIDVRNRGYAFRRRECLACGHRFSTEEHPQRDLQRFKDWLRVCEPEN